MPKIGADARAVRDALIRDLRAQGWTLQQIADDPDVRLSAMSVSRVLAAFEAADQRSAELSPSQVVDEHGRVVDFTSRLERWRMEHGNHPGPAVAAAYERWRSERLEALPDQPPALDPGAGVDAAALAAAADAVGVSVAELMARLWRDDTTGGLGRDETILAQGVDSDAWLQEAWAGVQSYRRWLSRRREQFLSGETLQRPS